MLVGMQAGRVCTDGSMSQALPLPTIPEGTDDESYGDGMDMDTLLDEMGLGDDDSPTAPPRLLQSYVSESTASKSARSASPDRKHSPPRQSSASASATASSFYHSPVLVRYCSCKYKTSSWLHEIAPAENFLSQRNHFVASSSQILIPHTRL